MEHRAQYGLSKRRMDRQRIATQVKYASDGELQLVTVRKHLSDVLKVPPIFQRGNVNEIIGKFGGAEQLRSTVNRLQSLLYVVYPVESHPH